MEDRLVRESARIGANKNEEGVNISAVNHSGNGFAACGGGFVWIGGSSGWVFVGQAGWARVTDAGGRKF